MNPGVIPYGRQSISEKDIQAVIEVLRSDWLTQGPMVETFERLVAEYCGATYAVAVNNATSALHLACLASGVGSEDTLWTSPNTFVASANCALYCGGKVDFVDIDPQTYNLDVSQLESKLALAEKTGKLPKLVIPVHFAGQSCQMDRIKELSCYYGFSIIEDASHAIGGRFKEHKIGSCVFSDMTVFSFHPVKIITTGEGGMILTNRRDLYEKLVRLRSHGITRDPALMEGESDGPWYYQQIELGCNYRMTDIQAALGSSQMGSLDCFVIRRHKLAQRYDRLLADLPLVLPRQAPEAYSAFHLYVVRIDPTKTTATRRQVFDRLRAADIGVNVHYIPVYLQPYYRHMGFKSGYCPESERYYGEALSIPLYHGLSESDQERVVVAIAKSIL